MGQQEQKKSKNDFFESNIFKEFCFLSSEIALESKGRAKILILEILCLRFSNYNINSTELKLNGEICHP